MVVNEIGGAGNMYEPARTITDNIAYSLKGKKPDGYHEEIQDFNQLSSLMIAMGERSS